MKFSPTWHSDNDGNVPRGFGSSCHTARRFSIQAQELEGSHPYCLRALLSAGTQHSRASQTASDAITHSSAITKLLLRGGKCLSGHSQDKAGECQNSTGRNSAQSPQRTSSDRSPSKLLKKKYGHATHPCMSFEIVLFLSHLGKSLTFREWGNGNSK